MICGAFLVGLLVGTLVTIWIEDRSCGADGGT